MLSVSHSQRRANIEGWIAASPWSALVYRKGRTPDDADTTFTVTGRVSPVGVRGTPLSFAGNKYTEGEMETQRYASVLVTAWNATQIKSGDMITATHVESGIVVNYVVSFVRRTPHKYEIIMDEVQ